MLSLRKTQATDAYLGGNALLFIPKTTTVSKIKTRKFSSQQTGPLSNTQLDSDAVRTKTIETRWNECEKYLHIHFLLSLSSKPLFQAEFNISKKAYYNSINILFIYLFIYLFTDSVCNVQY